MKAIRMIFLGALAASGCYGSPASQDPGAAETRSVQTISAEEATAVMNVRFDEAVTYTNLEIRWLEISDSRCPKGVTCVWAGEVKVTLEVNATAADGIKTTELQLTRPARGKAANDSIDGYEFELLDVDPYPVDRVTPARGDYVARIKVSKTGQGQ